MRVLSHCRHVYLQGFNQLCGNYRCRQSCSLSSSWSVEDFHFTNASAERRLPGDRDQDLRSRKLDPPFVQDPRQLIQHVGPVVGCFIGLRYFVNIYQLFTNCMKTQADERKRYYKVISLLKVLG